MRFEKFLLDDYLQTKEGKKWFDFFSNFRENFFRNQEIFFKIVDSVLDLPEAETFFYLKNPKKDEKTLIEESGIFQNIDDFINEYFNNGYFEEEPRYYQGWIPFFSVLYFIEQSEYAFPYLFPVHFYRLQEICQIFDIQIPELPGKTKHLDRIHYYFDLCRSMYEFRKQNNLSPVEFCVFLYGFAPRYFEKYIENELPAPNSIHLVGASNEDVENFIENPPTESTISFWQGYEGMMPGDIIIMYEKSPYSRISSIWRAVSPGYDDPFQYYSGKILLGHPIKIPNIEFKKLSFDPVWGNNSLVKAHMEGIGTKRTLVSHKEYESLKKLIKKADSNFFIASLPEPPPYAQFYHEDIEIEKDVEEKLLEPLLVRLGYDIKQEITRQFPIRMGRGVRYYPDYALHAKGTRGEESADFIWEAKYRIPTQKQLREDYGQAKSYAIRLQTRGFGLVSIEGIKIWIASNHFDFEKMISYSWEELELSEKMGKIKILFNNLCKPKNKLQPK